MSKSISEQQVDREVQELHENTKKIKELGKEITASQPQECQCKEHSLTCGFEKQYCCDKCPMLEIDYSSQKPEKPEWEELNFNKAWWEAKLIVEFGLSKDKAKELLSIFQQLLSHQKQSLREKIEGKSWYSFHEREDIIKLSDVLAILEEDK